MPESESIQPRPDAGHPPNILLLCTDQQRFDALGAAGNSEIHTPNLDRLAGQGVQFTNCYVQSPVCGPSRASLMTSRYVHQHGLWANGVALPDRERLFSRVLADAGYDCGLAGKFHLSACIDGRTETRHDDGFRVFRWAHDPQLGSSENQYHRWLRSTHPQLYRDAADPASPVTFDHLPTEAHFTRWIGDQTIDYLTDSRKSDQPFFFVANFFDPHHPFGAPRAYVDRYEPDTLSRPITRTDELAGKPAILTEASHQSYAGHAPGYTDYTADQLQQIKAEYYAMVTFIDDEVGRIMTTLDEQGLADNTLVVFTSDHGEMLGDHQLMLKGPMCYECAVRVPLLMRWPGELPAGVRCEQLVQWIDLAPTFLAAAGAPSLPYGAGRSLLPLARQEPDAVDRGWALCEYRNSGHPYDPPVRTTMLRHDRWKLICYHEPEPSLTGGLGELYDLKADPHELDNLWDVPSHLGTRAGMQQILLDVLVATEDRQQPRDGFW